ncbi:hypothetical protein [Brumimicrobium mesophilum]|uniref:hypothetical protein n=1 Tax=Brumimicrobium mesophilum TaxID=392717 RepID=UPI000D1415F0|nr:hypothetical protein [Brumimicrobium mesophilum]
MRNILILLLLTFLLSSCLFHFVTDNYYSYLTPIEQARIKHLSAFEDAKAGNVYKITGNQLMEELKNHEKSMVYSFANSCPSHSINHLYEEKKYAEENGLKLFLIMSNYSNMAQTINKKLGLPLYSINNEAYGIEKSRKYYKKFREEIGFYEYQESLDGMWPGSYLFYEGDKLVDGKNYLTEEQEKAAKANK